MAEKLVTVLDLGTHKITVKTGSMGVNNNFNIFATGEIDYAGYLGDEFLEPENLKSSVISAINSAQINLKSKIDNIYIGVPAEFCYNNNKELKLEFKSKIKIKQKNIDYLFSLINEDDTSDQTIISKSPMYYYINNEKVFDPIGMVTNSIFAYISVIYANNKFIEIFKDILKSININSYTFVSSNLAESLYLLDKETRQNGAVIIDVGYISSSIAYILNEGLLELKSFSLGGGFITSDLSEILKLSFSQAEQLKRKLILTVKPTAMDYYEINVKESLVKVDAKTVNDIALARIDMIAEGIKKCLSSFANKLEQNSPIYLTGGGISYLKGIKYYLGKELGRKIIVVAPKPLQLNFPINSCIISLLSLSIRLEN